MANQSLSRPLGGRIWIRQIVCPFASLCLSLSLWWAVSLTAATVTNATTNNYVEVAGFVKCGPNALFVFLILTGHPEVTLEQFENLPVSAEGASLQTLREAARAGGVETEIRRYQPADLGAMPLPAIAQFKSPQRALTRYHFNVVYKVEGEWVYLVEGTTGVKFKWRRALFNRSWTGMALTERRVFGGFRKDEGFLALLTVGLLAVDGWLLFGLGRRHERPAVFKKQEVTL